MGYVCGRSDHAILVEYLGRSLELWARKAMDCLELSGNLEDNPKTRSDDGVLACEISEGSQSPLKTRGWGWRSEWKHLVLLANHILNSGYKAVSKEKNALF